MTSDLLTQYRALVAKVDAFWVQAVATQPTALHCAHGCDTCCHQRLTVFGVEAAAIHAHLATLDPALRETLRADDGPEGHCAFLKEARCTIYPVRPIICRSHGLPIRVDGAVDHCPLNFTEQVPEPAVILDLEQINTLLALVDRLHAEAAGDPVDRPRISLADLARISE